MLGADRLGDLGGRRRAPELARELLHAVVDLHHALLHAARDVDGPAVVTEVALELAEHRRHRVGRERGLARGVEAVDRLDQPERRHLDEVVERLVGAAVAPRHPPRQRQQARDELLTRGLVALAVIADEQPPVLPRARSGVLNRTRPAGGDGGVWGRLGWRLALGTLGLLGFQASPDAGNSTVWRASSSPRITLAEWNSTGCAAGPAAVPRRLRSRAPGPTATAEACSARRAHRPIPRGRQTRRGGFVTTASGELQRPGAES